MGVTIKYQSKQKAYDGANYTFKETYQGFENDIDGYISSSLSGWDAWIPDKGYITSWRKTQADGPFYNVAVEYSTNVDSSTSHIDDNQIEATLDTRTIQLPLNKLPNYKYKWDHFLLARIPAAAVTGQILTQINNIWNNDVDGTMLSGSLQKTFEWSDFGKTATHGQSNGNEWKNFKTPTKKGVKYYEVSYFVVNEVQKYSTAVKAGNAVKTTINKLQAPSNTFGLNNANQYWKLDSSSISYNGRFWIVKSVYTFSIDPNGWDQDLYTTV